jgi:hypothetical protein
MDATNNDDLLLRWCYNMDGAKKIVQSGHLLLATRWYFIPYTDETYSGHATLVMNFKHTI